MHLTGTTFQPHVDTLNRANIFHGVGCALVHLTQHFHGCLAIAREDCWDGGHELMECGAGINKTTLPCKGSRFCSGWVIAMGDEDDLASPLLGIEKEIERFSLRNSAYLRFHMWF